MRDLTGQGKPFYSALDQAAQALKRNVGTGQEFMQELAAQPGVKQQEIQDRMLAGLAGLGKMNRDEFVGHLKSKPVPAIREKVLGETMDPASFRKEVNNFIRSQARRYASNMSDNSREYRILAGDEMRRLRGNSEVPEYVASVIKQDDGPYHEKWTLPGGENYREMLIKAPRVNRYWAQKFSGAETKYFDDPDEASKYAGSTGQAGQIKNAPEQFPGVEIHFNHEPGILASMRLKDRTGPNGEKLLHLEELQSDWHQQGREQGYKDPQAEQKIAQMSELKRTYDELNKRRYAIHEQASKDIDLETFDKLMDEANSITPKLLALNSQMHDLEHFKRTQQNAIPDAPFKKNWEEMALKRLIHHAAEKGYHGIVVTPGEEQADRYSLAKHLDALHYNPDTHRLIGKKNGRMLIDEVAVPPEKLEAHVGKDVAKKIMGQEPNVNGLRSLIGEDLVVGGEGMKGFYDKKVPNILNAIGKKYGVKTELHGHAINAPKSGQSITDMLRAENMTENDWQDMHPDQRMAMIDRHDQRAKQNKSQLHYFPITEDMRKDILTNGLPLYAEGGVIHKAQGGNVQPTSAQMKLALMKANPLALQSIGANEAPDMSPKAYLPPDVQTGKFVPPGGAATPSGMPVGGIDMSRMQPGQQLMPQNLTQPQPQGQPGQQGPGPMSQPQPTNQQPQAPQGMNGNILEMTPAGRALNALSPNQPGMAKGAHPPVEQMKAELAAKKTKKPKKADTGEEKRVLINAEGPGGVKGIVVPKHLITGNPNSYAEGLENMMEARAKVYGPEHREPLSGKKIEAIHKQALHEHFQLPIEEQRKAEEEALNRLREAKFIKHNKDTLDESEKLDTVHHEYDDQGRSHVGYASKGIAGHALFPQGHGEDMDYKVLNTCAGQTTGCGGGVDANGIVDTKRGTCFAPNAESQYAAAASRRAGHTIAKHDPAMTKDWIIAHTGSMRNAAEKADKNNQRMLFRPNVVDETDTTSRHVIRHLNRQRQAEDLPDIISNQYGKTNELHDPENGYYVTHSNIGPKVKHGHEITENIGRDKQRVRNTVLAADNKGDFKNEQGNLTPPKGSYLVTDVKRGSPMSKQMEEHITHAKYWSTGRAEHELTPEEKAEGPEGHFGPNGKATTPEKAHYGHTTVNGRRYDYQKQHILHPRLVQVGHNEDGTPHMIPTDSRFKDEEFLPKKRFMTKNGKKAGHILMTTPTESTDNVGHETTFTHNVSPKHIEYAKKNKGEYEIDNPMEQEKARGKEYVAPKPINIVRKAHGGTVGGRHHGYEHDDFFAFPEQNIIAQHHLAKRLGDDEIAPRKAKSPVAMHKNIDTMRLEMMRKK